MQVADENREEELKRAKNKRAHLKKKIKKISVESKWEQVEDLALELINFYWNEDKRSGHLLSALYKHLRSIDKKHTSIDLRHLSKRYTAWDIEAEKGTGKPKSEVETIHEQWAESNNISPLIKSSDNPPHPTSNKIKPFLKDKVSLEEKLKLVEKELEAKTRLNVQFKLESIDLKDKLNKCDELYFRRIDTLLHDLQHELSRTAFDRIKSELDFIKFTGIARTMLNTPKPSEQEANVEIDTAIYAGNPGNRRKGQFS
jgi:hypothetical protein